MENTTKHVLLVSASGQGGGSVSRQLSRDLIAALQDHFGEIDVKERDVARGMPFVDEPWIGANFTPEETRTDAQREALAYSDSLVAELEEADIVVIGTPMYNFSIPASLKAWIDMVTRARKTFRYTEKGPEGLLKNKKAYVVVATGGVGVGSDLDFVTPYLRHILSFVGIDDVDVIAADRLQSQAEEAMDSARMQIAERVHLTSQAA